MNNTEIIYNCDSLNNTRVRANELKMLDKNEEGLYIVIGENNVNSKKRYYNNIKKLNKDYNELLKIKAKLEEKPKTNKPSLGTRSRFEEVDLEENK